MLDPYRMAAINVTSFVLLGASLLFYLYLHPKKKINLFFLLIVISLFPLVSLLRKGTYESGDLTLHSVFLRSFYENLQDGNLIPIWAANLCGGYGCPVFEFEYILPFYMGSLFHLIGFSFINSIKFVLALSFVLSGIGMYMFIKEELGKKEGFLAGLVYLFAPYHLQEMHFRVGIGILVSFLFVPFLFYEAKKIIETRKMIYVLAMSFTLLFLILAHSTAAILVLPLLGIYFLVSIYQSKEKLRLLLLFATSFFLGVSLACFYWLPALKEVGYTWYSKGFTIQDFKPIQDYLFSPVMYGFLLQGHQGELRLIIGYVQLITIGILCVVAIKRKKIKKRGLILFSIISFFVFFFLLLRISKPVWESVPLLKTSILPWRVLLPISFITALSSGLLIKNIQSKNLYILLCISVVAVTILNWGNRKTVPVDPNAYLNHWSLYTEYIEQGNPLLENNFKKKDGTYAQLILNRPSAPLEIISGAGSYREVRRNSTVHQYLARAESNVSIKENTFYFPGWKVVANYKEIPIVYKDKDNPGLITFNLKKGLYKIDVVFTDTPVRKISKMISIVTLIGIVFIISSKFLKRFT